MTTQEILSNLFCSFAGTIGFAIMYNVPKKYYIGCGVTGMAGWIVYLLVSGMNYVSAAVGSFFGAFIVVLISRMLSVKMRCPITIFLISGILPLVPGAGIYNTVYYIVTNQLTQAALKGIESLKIAFAIVMGIVIVVSIPRDVFHKIYYWYVEGKD
ncbi:threonine/serine exporter family protein [Lachnospiraceae bacterium MD308]|nr:threonine/serine exporter family protein [Lachnospiraceae bacterium MD308]